MRRKELLQYLHSRGCALLREGAKHSWWCNPALNKRSATLGHAEIVDIPANKICKDLGAPPVKQP